MEVIGRVDWLISLTKAHKGLKFYLSSVVMRMPAYNSGIEEAWYWQYYGYNLYQFSYYLSKYKVTLDPADLKMSEQFQGLVPPAIVEEFLWRRERNHNVVSSSDVRQCVCIP